MKRWHRWALGVVAAVGLAGAATLTWLYVSFDPGAYRSRIEALATEAVGRQVRIQGPIELNLLPFPAVVLKTIEIDNPGDIGARQLARIKRVDVSPRPLSLMAGKLAVGTVTISGLEMMLARNRDGQNNWQGIIDALAAGPGQALGAPNAAVRSGVATSELPLSSMSVSALEINDARIRYVDGVRGQTWQWRGGRVQTGRMTDGSPFRLEITGRLRRADSAVRAEVYLMTRIEPHLADRFYRFSRLNLNLLIDGNSVPGGMQEASISASGEADFAAGRYSLSDFLLQSGGLAVAGKIDGKDMAGHTHYNGRLTIKPFSPRSVLQQLRIRPPLIRDSAALGHAGFDAQFEGNEQRVRFKQIAAQLDESHLTGTASIAQFGDPLVRFDLALDRLDADRYLPPVDENGAAVSVEDTASDDDHGLDQLWPALDRSRFQGTLRVGYLDAAGLRLADAEARLSARPNEARIERLTAAAYNGRLAASARIKRSEQTTTYSLNTQWRHIAVGALLSDLVGVQRLTGLADIDAQVTTRGRTDAQRLEALDGTLSASLTDGRLAGYDLDGAIRGLRGAEASGQSSAPVTPIKALAATVLFEQGIARTTRMAWQNTRFHGEGEGEGRYALADDRLDYRFRITPRESARPPVLMRLTGPLGTPTPELSVITTDASTQSPAADAGS